MLRVIAVLSAVLVCAELALGGLFGPRSPVKMLDSTNFQSTLSEERTAVVAFVAPWCGHCQRLSPEYERAAKSLDPLVPFYAIDCDADENKPVCATQGVQGFPTIKSFPRGLSRGVSHPYQSERTADALIEWARQEVPNRVKVLRGAEAVSEWATSGSAGRRALLLSDKKTLPTLWRVLGVKFHGKIEFAVAKDEDMSIARSLGLEGKEKSKVLLWRNGERELYSGQLKYWPLVDYFDADLEDASQESRLRDEL